MGSPRGNPRATATSPTWRHRVTRSHRAMSGVRRRRVLPIGFVSRPDPCTKPPPGFPSRRRPLRRCPSRRAPWRRDARVSSRFRSQRTPPMPRWRGRRRSLQCPLPVRIRRGALAMQSVSILRNRGTPARTYSRPRGREGHPEESDRIGEYREEQLDPSGRTQADGRVQQCLVGRPAVFRLVMAERRFVSDRSCVAPGLGVTMIRHRDSLEQSMNKYSCKHVARRTRLSSRQWDMVWRDALLRLAWMQRPRNL